VDLSAIESNAKDFARKFAEQATADIESLKKVLQTGSSKVRYVSLSQFSGFLTLTLGVEYVE
jgi:hypothetical protein